MFLLRIRKDFDLVQRYWGPKGRGKPIYSMFNFLVCFLRDWNIFRERSEKCNMMLYFDRNALFCALFLPEIVLVCYYCASTTVCMLPKLFLMPTYNLSTFWQDEGPTNLDNHHELPLHLLRMTCASSSALQCYFRQFHFRRANLRLLCSDFAKAVVF